MRDLAHPPHAPRTFGELLGPKFRAEEGRPARNGRLMLLVLHQHNTQHLSLVQRGRARIQPDVERTLVLAQGYGGTAWAKPCFCSHVGPRS
jgi:hypothetical protein